jgi:hypothetical protein
VRPNLIPKLTVTTPDLVPLHFLQVGEHSGKESGGGEYVGNVAERDPNQLGCAEYPCLRSTRRWNGSGVEGHFDRLQVGAVLRHGLEAE